MPAGYGMQAELSGCIGHTPGKTIPEFAAVCGKAHGVAREADLSYRGRGNRLLACVRAPPNAKAALTMQRSIPEGKKASTGSDATLVHPLKIMVNLKRCRLCAWHNGIRGHAQRSRAFAKMGISSKNSRGHRAQRAASPGATCIFQYWETHYFVYSNSLRAVLQSVSFFYCTAFAMR